MICVVCFILFPLCMHRHIRQVREGEGNCTRFSFDTPFLLCRETPLSSQQSTPPLGHDAPQFEKAATVGVTVVIALSAIIISKAVSLGFPAVSRGELPVFSLKVQKATCEVP